MVLILNHYERALALLASQFRGQKLNGDLTNLQKLIRALVKPAQELEDVNYELLTERSLEIAIGQQLDEIGIILGLPRADGESDEDYRERLKFQIFINSSVGSPEDAIRTLKFLTKANNIGYYEVYPAFYVLETDGLVFPNPPNDLNEALFSISPAGVNYAPIIATYNVDIPFQLSGDLSTQALGIAPDQDDPSLMTTLEIEQSGLPTNAILFVSAGSVDQGSNEGGLDELNFPLENAGTLSELIQINGNFPPRR